MLVALARDEVAGVGPRRLEHQRPGGDGVVERGEVRALDGADQIGRREQQPVSDALHGVLRGIGPARGLRSGTAAGRTGRGGRGGAW